jgi:diguanylate cyclase (GGDEF)-like protein
MTRAELSFRGALVRFVFALIALTVLPVLEPKSVAYRWVFAAYFVSALAAQILIRKDIGGNTRAIVTGIIDCAVLTFVVHQLGSISTVFVSLYFVAAVLNTVICGLRVGLVLAAVDAGGYVALVWSEHFGLLSYAPDVRELAAMGAPDTRHALAACLLVATFLFTSTFVVGTLVRSVERHEADLVAANLRLEDLSRRDALTNLFNRRYLLERLEGELARVKRGQKFALLMVDLDGFKRVNDLQGHLRGDLLLKEIADVLGATTRLSDVTGRYGGDEFVLLLPDTDEEQARVVAERITAGVRDVGARFDGGRPITASVGLAVGRRDDGAASILRRADENAYRAKKDGGDRVVA